MTNVAHHWAFDGGEWEASSVVHDDGVPFTWRIGVCDDGSFSVTESDSELTDRRETFATLCEAKEFCRVCDSEALSKRDSPPYVQTLRSHWGTATTGQSWEMFLEQEIEHLHERVMQMNALLGTVRMKASMPAKIYEAIDAVIDQEHRN